MHARHPLAWLSAMVVAVAAMSLQTAHAQWVNTGLIQNGSFEVDAVPAFPGYTSSLTGWVVSGPNHVLNDSSGPFYSPGPNGPVPDGTKVAGIQGIGTLQQDLPGLVNGRFYRLDFHYNLRVCCGGAVMGIRVRIGSQTIYEASPIAVTNPFQFRQQVFQYDAAWGTTLVIESINPTGDATILYDDFRLFTPVAHNVSYTPDPPAGGSISGPATINTSGTPGDGITVTVTPNSGFAVGTVTASNGTITPAGGDNYTLSGVTADTVVTATFDDIEPPSVITMTPNPAGPTNTGPVNFTVEFSETVTNFGFNDVQLSTTGTVSASILTIIPSPGPATSFQVEVGSITGDGTLVLDIVITGDVQDLAGNQLVLGASSPPVTIDNTPPEVVSITPSLTGPTNATSMSFVIEVSEPVTDLFLPNLQLNTTGTVNAAIDNVTPFPGPSTTFTVTVGGISGDGTLALEVLTGGTAQDLAGNLFQVGDASPAVTIDNTAPEVLSVTPNTTGPTDATVITFEVVVSEPVTDLFLPDLQLNTTGTVNAAIDNVTPFPGPSANFTVTVGGISGDGTLALEVLTGGTAQDIAGNPLATGGTSDPVIIENNPVEIAVGPPTPAITNTGPVSYALTYTNVIQVTLDESDITLVTTGTANGDVSVTDGATSTPTVTIANITGDGTIAIEIAAGTAESPLGTPAAPASGVAFTVDNTPPGIAVSAPSAPITATGPVSYTISYTGVAAVTLDASDVTLVTTGSATGSVSVSGAKSNEERTVTVSNIAGDGTLAIDIAAGTAVDAAGNEAGPISGAPFTVDSAFDPTPSVPVAAPLGLGLLALTMAGLGLRRRMR